MDDVKKIEEAELWKIRAFVSEKKYLMTEINFLRMKHEQTEEEISLLLATLKEKYKCDDIDSEGNLVNHSTVSVEPGDKN